MRVIIIDGQNVLHRAYHKFKNMTSKSGKPSSVVYGFPYIIGGIVRKFNPDAVIVPFDYGRNQHRLDALPDYKNREKRLDFDYEDFIDQSQKARKILKALGVPTIKIKGQEADDLIYMMVKEFTKKGYNEIIIVSSDKDFQQLVNKKVSIWNTTKNMLITHKNHVSVYGYTPKQSIDYLILDGDKSDKIPGYRGMGEKRIKAFLEEHSSIRKFLRSKKEHKGLDRVLLEEIYKRNRLLIDIKYFCRIHGDSINIKIKKGSKKIDHHYLSKIGNTYDINTFCADTFLKPFKKLL